MQKDIPLRPARYTQGQNHRRLNSVIGVLPVESFAFGLLVALAALAGGGRLPRQNVAYLSFDKLPVADGTITGGLQVTKLDGTVVAAYSVSRAYDTSGLITMDQLKATILTKDTDFSVELLPDYAGNAKRIVKITAGADKKLVISTPFTSNGTSPPTITPSYSSADVIAGGAWKYHVGQNLDGSGVQVKSADKQMIDVINDGDLIVPAAGSPKRGNDVYVLLDDYDDGNGVMPRGSVRPNTNSGAAPVLKVDGAKFMGPAVGGLAPVSFNIAAV